MNGNTVEIHGDKHDTSLSFVFYGKTFTEAQHAAIATILRDAEQKIVDVVLEAPS